MADQCGYFSYCLNAVCASLYSQPDGTPIPTIANNIGQVCTSGFLGPKDGVTQGGDQTCQSATKNNNDVTVGVGAAGTLCQTTQTPTAGAVIT
jgi:hypothetical protein